MISRKNVRRLGHFVLSTDKIIRAEGDDRCVPDLDKLDGADIFHQIDDGGMIYTKASEGTTLKLLTPKAVSLGSECKFVFADIF